MSRPWPAWWTARALALLLGGITALAHRGNVFYDLTYYGNWATGVLDGSRIPYLDFPWEYPPAALPAMLPPAVITWALPHWQLIPYAIAWVVMVLAIDAAILRGVLRRVPAPPMKQPAVVLWIVGPALLGSLSWARFDMIPAAAALIAVFAAGSARTTIGGVAAGIGATLKLWPGLLAPIQRTRTAAVRATATAAAVVLAVAGVTFVLTGSTGFAQVLHYQSERGLQIESVAALPLLWLRQLGVDGYSVKFAFGAFEIAGPGVPILITLTTVVFAIGLAVVGVTHWLLMRNDAGRRGVGLSAVVLLLVVILGNKVFSPQYILWLLAVIVAAAALDPETWRPLVKPVLALAALTQLVFPLFYGDVMWGAWPGVLFITARDLLLVWLLFAVVRQWMRHLRDVRTERAPAVVDRSLVSVAD